MDARQDQIDLQEYVQTGSRQALGRLAGRYVDFVYGVARRQTGDSHLAEDVSQAVFLVLARKAYRIKPAALSSWLFVTTRKISSNARKMATRRRFHERQAAAFSGAHVMSNDPLETEFTRLQLDEALAIQSESDRGIVLMRYMQGMDVRQISQTLGLTEPAARRRLERVLERMRKFLAGRGVALSTTAMGTCIGGMAEAAPASLSAAVVGGAASAGGAALAGTVAASASLVSIKVAAAVLLCVGVASGITASVWVVLAQQTAQVAAPATMPTAQPGQTAVIFGNAVDFDGKPLSDVRVWSQLVSDNPALAKSLEVETITDATGRYELPPVPVLPTGRLRKAHEISRIIRFDHPGFAPAWREIRPRPLSMQTMSAGGGYLVRMDQPTVVQVQAVDEKGNPISGAQVTLRVQQQTQVATNASTIEYIDMQSKTDAQGIATFTRIGRRMRATVTIVHPDFAIFRDSTASVYAIRPGGGTLVAKLSRGGNMRIRVSPNSRLAGREAEFVLYPVNRPRQAEYAIGVFDANGSYLFTSLAEGNYDLVAVPMSTGAVVHQLATGVSITPGQVTDVTLSPDAGRLITGRVTDINTGQPLANQEVEVYPTQRQPMIPLKGIFTDADGRYLARIFPGRRYELAFGAQSTEYLIAFGSLRTDDVQIVDMALHPMLKPRGRLTDHAGNPVSGFVAAGDMLQATQPDGAFEVSAHYGQPQPIQAFNSDRTLGRVILSDESFTDQSLTGPRANLPSISLRALATITGQLVSFQGGTLRDVNIDLSFSEPGGRGRGSPFRSSSMHLVPELLSSRIDETGRFTIDRVPTGLAIYMRAIARDGTFADLPIENLSPGELRDLGPVVFSAPVVRPQMVNADLTHTLSGHVLDQNGAILPGFSISASTEAGFIPDRPRDLSDHEGKFFLAGLPRNTRLTLLISSDYRDTQQVTIDSNAESIDLRPESLAVDLIGKPAPELAVEGWINSPPLTMGELRGNVVLLAIGVDRAWNFITDSVRLSEERYRARGLKVVIVHRALTLPSNRPADLNRLPAQYRNFPIGIDMPGNPTAPVFGGETQTRYGVQFAPSIIMVDKKGIIRAVTNQENLPGWIEKLLAE